MKPDEIRPPSSSATKAGLQESLTSRHMAFTEQILRVKAELWKFVKLHLPPAKYHIDEIAEAEGFEVLPLPPYGCDPNPGELTWTAVTRMKNRVAKFNTTFNLTHVTSLPEQ